MDASPDGSSRRSSGRSMGPDPSPDLSGSQSVSKCESTPESESDFGSASTDFLTTERVARPATKRFHLSDWRPLVGVLSAVDTVEQRCDGPRRLRDNDDDDDDDDDDDPGLGPD